MPNPSLGVIFHPSFPPEMLVDYARRAEAGGFDELWLWEDCFWVGALTSAAIALAATERIKVGIGLMPATVRNPLFVAMEINTLARLYPGRFLPGFGHGVDGWMKQIGAAPKSSMKALEETVTTVRGLLKGETVSFNGDHVHVENIQLRHAPSQVPPLFIGGIREKTLRLAGRAGDGTIVTEMASPAYVRWARGHIDTGMAESGRTSNHLAVFAHSKVNNKADVRTTVRELLGETLSWAHPHLQPLGIADEARALYDQYGPQEAAKRMPEAWVDELSVSGTPEQAVTAFHRLAEAGADSIILLPLKGDKDCLDEYIQFLLPALKSN